ncbi:MAG TPA: Do family serine endopeptidase [Candidatus Xenobia bacterium]|nr:Do family serine endopeptidase [Candidatus Xenobia bacterium]
MASGNWTQWIRQSGWPTRLAILATLAVGILLGTLISNGVRASRSVSTSAAEALSIPSPADLSTSFNKVAEAIEPAVVNITASSKPRPAQRRPRRTQPQDPFQDFFDRFFQFENPEELPRRGLGSGIIVDSDGYILTNYHVVEGADKLEVHLEGDNKDYRAQMIGYDAETDLAVIKINAGRKLPVAKMGNSDGTRVGDWVLAIGSPFGLDATVTAGIISYKGRPNLEPGKQFQRFIQTDAAINRGNSGGPLVNLAGEVIGINTAIFSSQGAFAGVGFALPSNIAVEVYNNIIKHGRVVRGSIGIQFDGSLSENPAILKSFGADYGVVIGQVEPGGPAEKAGLKRGDVIYQVDDTPVKNGDELVGKIAATPVGQKVKIHFIRDKKKQDAMVTIEDRAKVFPNLAGRGRAEPEVEEPGELGVAVEEVDAAQARRQGIEEDGPVLLVTEVEPGSLADDLGIVSGDLLLEMNHQRVRSVAQFNELQRRLRPGDAVVLYLMRRTQSGWVGFYRGGTLPQ